MLLSQRKKVRALPHVSRVHRVRRLLAIRFSGCERVKILPGAEIGGGIQQHAAALATLPGANTHVPALTFLPQARVAKAGQFGIARGRKDGRRKFGPRQKKWIAAGCQALRLQKIVGTVAKRSVSRCNGLHTGVQNREGCSLEYGAAGEAAVLIRTAGRRCKR